jgi:hypothetical protein
MKPSKLTARAAVVPPLMIATTIIGSVLLGGCAAGRREPVALAVVLDTSGSAWENRERGLACLETILRGSYLPKGSTLALVRCGRDSKVLWEGRVKDSAEILEAYRVATKGGAAGGTASGAVSDTGTDIYTALELSREWLTAQREQGMKQTILTGWVDLRADPAKEGGRVLRAVRPASAMDWPASKGIRVVLFGVAPEQARPLQKRWAPRMASVSLYGPAHRIRPEDLGLMRGVTF